MSRRGYGAIVTGIFLFAALIAFVFRKKKDGVLVFTALSAFFLRWIYILYTPTDIRQHDVIGFGDARGQAAYIEWFYNNGLKLIGTDPRDKWGFFQPPLHHILCAAWLKLNTLAGVPYGRATENIQYLMLIYSLLFLWYAYRLFRHFKLSGAGLYAAFALAAFHPSYILLSGSVNNDMLCTLLTLMTVYYALIWYESRKTADIIKLALSMGLSMMAKLSGVLTVPALAFLFIFVWIREGRRGFWNYLKQYLIFAVISIPLGMWFPVREYIKFGIPFNYTPEVGEELAGHGLLARIFDIRTYKPYVCMIKYGDAYDEFNIPLSLMKTSLTGEFDYSAENGYITFFAWCLLIAGALLAVSLFILTVYSFIKREVFKDLPVRMFLILIYVTALGFYANLCLSIPNFSSQDFRYICYIIVIEALLFGRILIYNKESGEVRKGPVRIIDPALIVMTALFCLSGTAVYLLLGLP